MAAAIAVGAPIKFDLPAQKAPAALQLFMKQGHVQVAYSADELKDVTTAAVSGEYEPAVALALLLKDTGFDVTQPKPGWFTVARSKLPHATTGSIRGSLSKGIAPGDDIRVMIRETGQQARTDRNGNYSFSAVDPGTYLLVATADGYQALHITDVVVKAGFDLSLSKEELRAGNGTLELQPYVVRAESVFELEKVEVTDTKPKPFSDRNVDLPRGINDVQPYYIFDSKTIDQSGAANVGDFLKQRLTMNTTASTPDQLSAGARFSNSSSSGPINTGSINLRGLGTNETLVLVDGRRMPNVAFAGSASQSGDPVNQPDINGIPLAAIDRIEILPSSASAIYGGNAVGGVINIILKKNYVGGEVKATYDVTSDGLAPLRTFSLSFGTSFEGGRTRLMLTAQYSDSKPLYVGDRANLIDRGYAILLKNDPGYIDGNFRYVGLYGFPAGYGLNPVLGATTNISSRTIVAGPSGSVATNLTLKGSNVSLNSPVATLPTGYTGDPSTIIGGQWNSSLPATNQVPNGLNAPLGSFPKNKSLAVSVSRDMTKAINVFVDANHYENSTYSEQNPFSGISIMSAADPLNPFNQKVTVAFPVDLHMPATSRSTTNGFTMGAILQLPWDWRAELDYTWSENKFTSTNHSLYFSGAAIEPVFSVVNPFADNVAHPPSAESLAPFVTTDVFNGTSTVNDLALRASGPVAHLSWGDPRFTIALEHLKSGYPDQTDTYTLPAGSPFIVSDPYAESTRTNLGQSQSDDSMYGELQMPLVKKALYPGLYSLEAQAAGRIDSYTVTSGTQSMTIHPDVVPPAAPGYEGPTLNGQPFSRQSSYTASNSTLGLIYKPIRDIAIRASNATAFLPPSYSQLLPNPQPDDFPATISDPKNPAAGTYSVQTFSGGNPNLKPQNSRSVNVGLIWEPQAKQLKGLRLNLEYYRITQHDAITGIGAQTILDNEVEFPGRVTRDPATGLITKIDTTMVNINLYKTSGWDLNVDYTRDTPIGTFEIYVAGTVIDREERQLTANTPLLDYVGWTNSGGEAKTKANGTLTWTNHRWSVAWSARYYGSYNQLGAPGDPTGTSVGAGSVVQAQGADTVPSQVYHDLFISYAFGPAHFNSAKWANRLLSGITIQAGVKNLFNKLPPFDAYYGYAPFYYSPYGDIRLRDVWLSVRKTF